MPGKNTFNTQGTKNYFNNRHKETSGKYFESPTLDDRIVSALHFYRFLSLFLTSAFYLLQYPEFPIVFKAGFILALLLAAILTVRVYNATRTNIKAVSLLLIVETVGIGFIMTFTGGFESPFIWYALNPLIIASLQLPLVCTWLFLGVFITASLGREAYIQDTGINLLILLNNLEQVLILLLITLAAQLFSRIYIILHEQSQRLRLQQEELFSAYEDLSESHQMIQALSDFQREIVSYKREEDIYLSLSQFSERAFPFQKTAVLAFDSPVPPSSLTPNQRCKVIGAQVKDKAGLQENNSFDSLILKELKDKWQELSPERLMLTGENRQWLALPIWNAKKRLMAVYVACLKPGTNLNQFPGSMSLFIYFAEQVVQFLNSLKQTEETLQHLSSLYEAVGTISSRSDMREVIDVFAAYAKGLTGCEKAIFWIEGFKPWDTGEEQNSIYTVKGKKNFFPEKSWQTSLLRVWSDMKENPQPAVHFIEDSSREAQGQLVCVPVKSRDRCFGMLAVIHSKRVYNIDEIIQNLTFLADLSSISIERSASESFTDKLMVIEEQNRIANEIHDSVSQNLFSIVYSIDVLSKQSNFLPSDFQERLTNVKEVAAQTAKELRLLIYRLSPRHRGDDTFVKELQTYINGLGNLNDVSIDFNVSGKEEHLNSTMRKAFYRILKEATGNAVRHGKCTKINVDLEMTPFGSKLEIKDNGKGFNADIYNNQECSHNQLGLENMRKLALSLGGALSIESDEDKGTVVSCFVPTSPSSSGEARVN